MALLSRPKAITTRARRSAAYRARRWERRHTAPLNVLAYHRVATLEHDPWRLAVSPESFDIHLATMRQLGDIVPLTEALSHRRSSRSLRSRPRFALTFDDGYACLLESALEVLERHDAPATMFIPTGHLGNPSFWWDRVSALVFRSDITLEEIVGAWHELNEHVLPPPSARESLQPAAVHEWIWTEVAAGDATAATERVDELVSRVGVDEGEPCGRPLSNDELARLARHPLVSIGAHTVNHPHLTKLDDEACHAEMVGCTRDLDELLGPAARVLAYPFGDADRRTARIARAAGFRFALTTRPSNVSVLDHNRLLPRIDPLQTGPATVESWFEVQAGHRGGRR